MIILEFTPLSFQTLFPPAALSSPGLLFIEAARFTFVAIFLVRIHRTHCLFDPYVRCFAFGDHLDGLIPNNPQLTHRDQHGLVFNQAQVVQTSPSVMIMT
jgi:hypothetical protein